MAISAPNTGPVLTLPCQCRPEAVFLVNAFRKEPNLFYQTILKAKEIHAFHFYRMSVCRHRESDCSRNQVTVFRHVIHLVDGERPIAQLSHSSQMGKNILLAVVNTRQCSLSRLMPYQIVAEQCPHRFKITLCQSRVKPVHFFSFSFHKSVL